MSNKQQAGGKTSMTKGDSARIMSAEAKKGGGQVAKDSFGARAQSTTDRRAAKK